MRAVLGLYVGWFGGSATERGSLTSDMLAALYLPDGQAEQPEVQPASQSSQLASQSALQKQCG